ncbi:MAG: HEPN domain-containing protein [Proteobacteria bacterium]|jgi:HEPN domain-containing protein|nr:HEPN domain-containing protein [Pseudomonadota bacterium]
MSNYTPTWKVWLQKANTDLLATQLMLAQTNDNLLEVSVYHSQQSAEKAIKSYLTFHKLRFSKTHIVADLLTIVAKQDSKLADQLKPADQLSLYAIAFRYPEEGQHQIALNRATAEAALTLASWVLKEIRAQLPRE